MNLLSARKQAVGDDAAPAVTALYTEHALGLTRLAHVMLDLNIIPPASYALVDAAW
jgi:hypothetical protein